MARINERGVYEIPGLLQGSQSIITLPTGEAVMKQGTPIEVNGIKNAFVKIDRPLDEIAFNMVVTIQDENGKDIPVVPQMNANGEMFLARSRDVASVRSELRAMVSINESFEDYDIPVGAMVCDPMYPNLGDWKVLTSTDAISMDRDVFKDVSILGKDADVLERAKNQMYETLRDGVERDQFEYNYNKVEEALSDSELYVDEKEKESVLNDLKAGKELAEELERTGGSNSTVNKVRETTIELGNEFEGHARKLLNFAKGIGAKVKDFFNHKGEIISTDELKAKGISEETAYAIHDEAELRQESAASIHKFGDAVRETAQSLKEKGIFVLANVFKKFSDIKIEHYKNMITKEQNQLEASLDRIRARARREGNTVAAEVKVRAFAQNIGKSIGNIGLGIVNTAGTFVKTVTLGHIGFDAKPYHPLIDGNGMSVTRSALSTAMYKHDDDRLINSTLHLAQLKAKLFHEQLSAIPMAGREMIADEMLGKMAEAFGKTHLMNHEIDYVTLEGRPEQQVAHTLKFTKDGLFIDEENMKENKYKGLSRKLSPNAMMHLFVQAERHEMTYRLEIAEKAAPEIVKALNNENVRASYNIANALERHDNYSTVMSGVHKEVQDAFNLMKNGYTFADKLQEKADMEAEAGEEIDDETLEECYEH